MFKPASVIFLAVLIAASGCRKRAERATGEAQSGSPATAAQPAPPKPMPARLPDVIARVNGEDVTRTNFELLVRNMESSRGPIPAERRDEILRGALDQLVTYTLLQQEARARNLTVSEAEIDEWVKGMQSQFASEAEFKKALDARSMSLERLRADARTEMLIGKLMDAEVAGVPPTTDAEAREFYEKNPDKFVREETVRASHILIKVDPKADDSMKKRARAQVDAILEQVRSGEDFARLARAHSQDGSAVQGGDLDFFQRGQMVPPFEQAAFALRPGQVSEVVTTPFGYHIIKVTDRRGASTVPLEQVSGRVKDFLLNRKKQERADAFVATMKQKSKIEVVI